MQTYRGMCRGRKKRNDSLAHSVTRLNLEVKENGREGQYRVLYLARPHSWRRRAARGQGAGSEDRLLNRTRASVWEAGKVLEMDGGDA